MVIRTQIDWRRALLGLGIVAGLTLAGAGTAPAAAQDVHAACGAAGTPAQPAARSTHRPASRPRGVTVTLNGHRWHLTLVGVARQTILQGTNTATAQATGTYVLVFLTVRNLDTRPQELYSDQGFRLTDAQGHSSGVAAGHDEITIAAAEYACTFATSTIAPRAGAQEVFPFDIARTARGLILQNAGDYGTRPRTALFRLGI